MTSDDVERELRDRLHSAIDPLVPDPNATTRVMDAVAASAAQRTGWARFRVGQGLATVLIASVVVLLVGGALGVSLALRSHTTPNGTSNHPVAPVVTPTPIPPSTPLPTPTPAPVVAGCDGTDLSAQFIDFDGAAGAEGGDIMLKNTSDSPCTMDGYTNLQGFENGNVTQLGVAHGQAVLINNSNGTMPTVSLITLQPGQAAYVAIEWTDVQSSATACATFGALLITPPYGRPPQANIASLPPRADAVAMNPPVMLCPSHGAAIWINEGPVSLTRYFYQR